MQIEAVRPSELSDHDLAAWRTLQAARGDALASPFLGPDWALAVERALGSTRHPVRVAVLREQGRAVGFLGVQAGARTALPIGSPVCDYQGLVAEPGVRVEARRLLQALGVRRYDFHHMLGDDPVFRGQARGADISYLVDVGQGYGAYEAETRARSDILKDTQKKRRKFERETGPLRFTAFSRSRADFEQLLAWKREQYRRTRQTDVLATPWVARLIEQLFEADDPDFGGGLFTLHAGDRLAAAQFHLHGRVPGGDSRVHAWFIAHDAETQRHSPGIILFADLIRWLAETDGFGSLDLGPVAYRFKDRLANRTIGITHGFASRPSSEALVRACAYGLRETVERLPLGPASQWPGKAMRRLDLWRGLA